MMSRCVSICLIVLALPSVGHLNAPLNGQAWAAPIEAQSSRMQIFWDSVVIDFQRNNCWPEPFVRPDRLSVRAPFVLMVNNGWRRQNMLADYHFEEGTNNLNEAGKLKIRWIMTEAPRHHRTIYVRRADTPETTAERLALVEQSAAQYVREGEHPMVLETTLDASGWPATRVDMIDRRWLDSTPDPRLPATQTGSSSSDQ